MNTLSKILLLVLLATGLSACHEDEVLITINVDSEQKISETQGNFDGELTINSEFGSAIAVIGDLESDGVGDLVVGSPHQNNRGAVRILFMDKDGTVDLQANDKVKSHQKISDDAGSFTGNLEDNDEFGSAIATLGDIDGDGITELAVGAPLAGEVVANADDIDEDGTTDLAVGLPFDDDGRTDSGAVFILFMKNRAEADEIQKVSSTQGIFNGILNSDDHFGSAIASVGDLNTSHFPAPQVSRSMYIHSEDL